MAEDVAAVRNRVAWGTTMEVVNIYTSAMAMASFGAPLAGFEALETNYMDVETFLDAFFGASDEVCELTFAEIRERVEGWQREFMELLVMLVTEGVGIDVSCPKDTDYTVQEDTLIFL